MKIKNEPRSWVFQWWVSVVVTFVMSLPLSWVFGVEWWSLFIIVETIAGVVSVTASMQVVGWSREDLEWIIETYEIDWDAFSSEDQDEWSRSSYSGERLYHPLDVPHKGPWIAILGLGTILSVLLSVLLSGVLSISTWKTTVSGIIVGLVVAGLSGFYAFLWVRETRKKLVRHSI